MGDSSAGLLFQRVAQPSIDPWVHANRLGITLKSTPENVRKRTKSPHSMPGRKLSARSPLSFRAKSSPVRFLPKQSSDVQYVQNIVVPIHAPTDDLNVLQSSHQFAFSAPRIRTALPKMHPPSSARASAPNFPSHLADNISHHYAHSLPGDSMSCKDSDAASRWNASDQALRYEHEQDIRSRSRLLKRGSQVRPHRVDRMYYISGSLMGMQPRYHVDHEEFQRLQELAHERRTARHYGRGLRTGSNVRFGLDSAHSDVRVPRQPPPSSMGDGDMSLDALNVAAMNVLNPRSLKSSFTADQASQAAVGANASEVTGLPPDKQGDSEKESASIHDNGASQAESDTQQQERTASDNEGTGTEATDHAEGSSGGGQENQNGEDAMSQGKDEEHNEAKENAPLTESLPEAEYETRGGLLEGDNTEHSEDPTKSVVEDPEDVCEDGTLDSTSHDVQLEPAEGIRVTASHDVQLEPAEGIRVTVSDDVQPEPAGDLKVTEEKAPVMEGVSLMAKSTAPTDVTENKGEPVVDNTELSRDQTTGTQVKHTSQNTPETKAVGTPAHEANPGRGPVVFEDILVKALDADDKPS